MKKRTALLIAVVLIILLIGFSTSIAIHFYHSSNNIEALCSACWRGDLDAAIRILRVNPGIVNDYDKNGWVPIQASSRLNGTIRIRMIELLLGYGANINAKAPGGETMLHFSVYSRDYSLLKFLLTKGIDQSIKISNDSGTALDIARRINDRKAIKFLTNNR